MTFPVLELQEAFTTALAAAVPVWETIASSYVPGVGGLRDFNATQGKTSDLDRDAAGTATFVVDVRDRELDPSNTASTHYPYVTPNRPIRLAVGYVAEVLRDNPRSYWRLGDPNVTSTAARDEQRSATATAVNTPTWQVDGVLTGNKAVTFASASSEYIDTGDLSLFEAGDCTYECWFHTVATSQQTLVSEGNSGTGVQFCSLQLEAVTRKPQIQFRNDANTLQTITGGAATNDGAWHHAVLTRSGSTVTLYVDGVATGGTASTSGAYTFNKSRIAAFGRNTDTNFMNGTIAEVAVYATALSAARVAAHYAAGVTGVGGYVHSGYVDAHNVSYRGPNDAVVTIPATDRFKLLARAKLVVVSAEDTAAQRIVDVLSAVGYYVRTYIYQGAAIMRAQSAGESQYALDTIMEAVDTENGRIFVDKDGVLIFISRSAVNEQNNYTASQATFTDTGAANGIPYTDIVFENSDTLLRNSVEIDHPEFDPITVTDATSIARNGTLTYTRTVFDATATAQNATAEAILAQYKDPHTRVLSVTVPTSRVTTSYPYGLYGKVLSLQLGMRVTIVRTPPGGGAVISQECFILSQSHACDATSQSWSTTFGFTLAPSANIYGLWDNAVWDTGKWGY